MKSVFYYLLPITLATSSLVAGPKPKPTNPFVLSDRTDSKISTESSEQKTADLRAQYDPLLRVDDDSAGQARNPAATASIGEGKTSALDPTSNSGQNHGMELARTPTRLDTSLIEDYIPGESSTESKSADGRMAVVTPSSTTRDLDRQRQLLERKAAAVKDAETDFQTASARKLQNPVFVARSKLAQVVPGFRPPGSKTLTAKMKAVEEAHEDLHMIATQFGAERLEDLVSDIEEDPKKIIVFDATKPRKETAPIAQSFKFGVLLKEEFQQLQQKTIANKLAGDVGVYGKSDPFGDMVVDLGRTHENNAIYSLTEETTTTRLDQERGQDNLKAFKRFVGENSHFQIAIASIMHQGGQSDFESIKLGAPRDAAERTSLPFFTAGVDSVMWRPHMEGPMLMKLFAGENRTESQIYNLEKTTSESGSPIFRLTAICTQSITNADFKYDLNRDVTYQFEANHSFDPTRPISEENSPITVTCLEGKIVQTFDEQRTPEQFAHQAAEYNLAVYQRRLEALGDPHQIETEYQKRIAFLASKAASRPGSITTQDRNAAEAKLQQLRKAQEDVTRAQQEVQRSSRRLDGTDGWETDSQSGFEDSDED